MEYFCKTHNKSCCVACISKIKGRGNGQHTDCDVCYIDEINDEKNKLNDNIKSLEDLSNSLNESINEWKRLFDKNENTKETLKINAQKIFTKLRNSLKEKEDNILLKIDNKFENDNNISKKSKKEKKNNSNKSKKKVGTGIWDDDDNEDEEKNDISKITNNDNISKQLENNNSNRINETTSESEK